MPDEESALILRFFGFNFFKSATKRWVRFEFRLWDKYTRRLILLGIAELAIGLFLCGVVIHDGEYWVIVVPIFISLRGLFEIERELSGRRYHEHQQKMKETQNLFRIL